MRSDDAELVEGRRFLPAQRLRRADEFDHAFRVGLRRRCAPFLLVAAENERGAPRLGLAVAKRYAPLAVERNRVKRQVREHFRLHRAELPPLDYVVCLIAPTQSLRNADLRKSLERAWRGVKEKCSEP